MEHEAHCSPWILKDKQTRSLQSSVFCQTDQRTVTEWHPLGKIQGQIHQ